MEISKIIEKLKTAQMILVGIGESANLQKQQYLQLEKILEGKNYFIVSLENSYGFGETKIKEDRITMPVWNTRDPNWEIYLKWLQGTLNKELLVLEIGVGFKYPDVIRFPFEKIVTYNNKASLVRVNSKIWQLPEELSSKGVGVNSEACEFLNELSNEF